MARSLLETDAAHVWHPFTQAKTAPPPIEIVGAQGAWLTAADGKRYLDCISSWWVNMHGHAHPKIARAIAEQAEKLEHVIFAGFTHKPAVELAERVVKLLPPELSRVFYSDNGSTAIEVALKMAYQYWRNRGATGRRRFIAFEHGYHGDTLGAMSVGRGSGFYGPFEDLMMPCDLIPFPATWDGDDEAETKEATALAALDKLLGENPNAYAAGIFEPLVQGAGGMRMCRPEFMQALAARLKGADVPLILDEVMTGFGRTGAMFACEKAGVVPDIICISKGITGGFLPLAATVATERIYEAFLSDDWARAFNHGHSYTANPLACAAGLASLDIFETDKTLLRIGEIEALYRERITALSKQPNVARTRVLGDIAAFDIEARDAGYGSSVGPCLKESFLAEGMLLRPLGNTIYLIPPYCITDAELHRAFDVIEHAVVAVA